MVNNDLTYTTPVTYILHLEAIGEDQAQGLKMFGFKSRAWVAEIIGFSDRYIGNFERRFLDPQTDYTHSNSKGSRGVIKVYYLYSEHIYEVAEPKSWKCTERYFCYIDDDGKLEVLTKEEVTTCLNLLLESMSI
jgi:hypothetical protein